MIPKGKKIAKNGKNKYFNLGAIGVLGLIFTSGWIQLLFGIYTAGCVIGAIKGDN